MRVSSSTNSAALARIQLANSALSGFLRAGPLAADRRAAIESRSSPLTTSFSSNARPAFRQTAGPGSLVGLLSSLATTTGSVGGSREKLGQVRGQLETILNAAVKARRPQLSGRERAEAQQTVDRAIAEIARLTGEGEDGTTVSGLDTNRPSPPGFAVPDSGAAGTITTILAGARPAQLYYDGNAGSRGFETGTFLISGGLGTRNVTFDSGSSLADLASLVNQQAGATGVIAVVQDNQLVFRSTNSGSAAEISVRLTLNQFGVSGVDPSSVAAFDVLTFQPGSTNTISGIVNIAAKRAEQELVGQNGRVTDTATFQLTGNLGATTISIQAGELLTDVADRINQQSSLTGVIASVNGDKLVFRSSQYGSAASVSIEVTRLEAVRGLNPDQVIDFRVESIVPNTNQLLSGRVTNAGEQAALKYSGDAGSLVKDDASINVAGNLGTAAFTVAAGESLAAVADRINQRTADTGVTATVVSDDLFFNSVGYGSSAEVYVGAASGTFDVSGGAAVGDGRIDYGKDATAKINGVNYVGEGNRFTVNLGAGTFVLEFAGDFEGDFDQISVSSASLDDLVNVSGVNGSQVSGFQVAAIDPGDFQTITGAVKNVAERAELKYSGDNGAIAKDAASINITGNLGTASFTVADGESLADLADRINQQSETTGVTAEVANNDLFLHSIGLGSSQSVFVEVVSGKFDFVGGSSYNGGEIGYGKDVKVTIDGVDYFGEGNRLSYSQGTGSFTFDFVEGFKGDFDAITVSSTIGADNLTDGANVSATGINRDQFASFQVNETVANSIQTVSGEVRNLAERAQLKYAGAAGSIKDDATFTVAGNFGTAAFSVLRGETLSDVAQRINQQTTATGVTASVEGNNLFLHSTGYGSSASVFVEVTTGKFDVSGGTGFNNGEIDYGKDVKARINGVDYVGDGNRVSFSDGSGSYTVDFVPGFEGKFDTVLVSSFSGAFELTGGNGDGTANGADARAVINGQPLIATGNRFSFSDEFGSYALELVPGFSGALGPINIGFSETSYAIGGGNGDGTAIGADAVVSRFVVDSTNPVAVDGDEGNVPQVGAVIARSGTRRSARVGFAVVDRLRHIGSFSLGLDISTLGGSAGTLQQLATGGGKDGLGAAADNAVSIVQQALAYVTSIENLLDQSVRRGVGLISEAVSGLTARDVNGSLLAIRNSALQSGVGLLSQFQSDPQRVRDLLL